MSIFFAWADILSEKNPYFGKHLFCKQRLVTRTSFVYKTSRLVMISLLINALNKRVLLFSRGRYFIKAIENLFSRVCISWYKHSKGWESSRQLCKPSTKLSRILPTPLVFILGYANTENVFYCLNGMLKFSEHWTRARCIIVYLLQGKEIRSVYFVFVHTKSLRKDGRSLGLRNLNPLSTARACPLFLQMSVSLKLID